MDIYTVTTERILSQLEKGVIPWRKTWANGLPKSLATNKEYRGANILLLSTSPSTSRYWVTFREAKRLGGFVRKGEKATPVVYWKWRTPEEVWELKDKTGKDMPRCFPFGSAVFNLDQVENIPRPADDAVIPAGRQLELANEIYQGMSNKPEIHHSVTVEPCYIKSLDRVLLPHPHQFESTPAYFSTLFHELVHNAATRIMPRRLSDVL